MLSHIDYVMQYGEDEEPKEVSTIPLSPLCHAALYNVLMAVLVSRSVLLPDLR